MCKVSDKTRVLGLHGFKVLYALKEKKIQKDDFHAIFNQTLGNFKAFYRIQIRSESLVDSAESESEYSVDHYLIPLK